MNTKMTEEDLELNIKICKILNLSGYLQPIHELVFGPGPGKVIGQKYVGKNYCNDLNAMQDVWNWCRQVLGTEHIDSLHWEGVRDAYGEKLEEYAWNKIKEHGGGLHYVLPNLSAKEKALCFVSAMNTIKEEK